MNRLSHMREYIDICFQTIAIFVLLGLCILSNPLVVGAQSFEQIEIPSTFNPVGSGARALGMGGAFIAIADDATAASWNPGGLIQLEKPEVSAVVSCFNRRENLDFGSDPDASGSETVNDRNVNYLSAAYPFSRLGRNMIVAVNYQHLFDLYRDWDFSLNQESTDFSGNLDVSHTSEGSLSAVGIAYAVQMTPRLSVGLTLNIWQDSLYDNQWETEDINHWTGVDDRLGPINRKTIDYSRYEFSGFNYNLGLLWAINQKLTIGAVFKAPFTADLDRHDESFIFIDDMETPSGYSAYDNDQELDMPMSYGVGFAYRFSDELTASLDILRTEWDDFILRDENGDKTSAISLMPADESDVDPTTQVRLGAEYLFLMDPYIIPFRGGCFYDPAPAEGTPDHYYGFSMASGIARGRLLFDIAYQYRFGNNVTDYIYETLDFSQDVKEHTIYSSIIYHF
jgi:long-chain fatty acid transport protein